MKNQLTLQLWQAQKHLLREEGGLITEVVGGWYIGSHLYILGLDLDSREPLQDLVSVNAGGYKTNTKDFQFYKNIQIIP